MEASPRTLDEHGALDDRPVHWDDDGRAFITGASVGVFGGDRTAHIRQGEGNWWIRPWRRKKVDEAQDKS